LERIIDLGLRSLKNILNKICRYGDIFEPLYRPAI